MSSRAGLVLMSGGARGAYQAGVLSAIAEILDQPLCPFPVLTGISAGAINCAAIASNALDFPDSTRVLAKMWSELRFADVFETRTHQVVARGLRWMTDLSVGSWVGAGRGRALLDPAPLQAFLGEKIDVSAIRRAIDLGLLHGLGITATHYASGTAVTFFDGHPSIHEWKRVTRLGVRRSITFEQVLASAAIPLFFPAVQLDGAYYGDGAMRMTAPVSPAVHLGADRIIAVAISPRDYFQDPAVLRHATPYPSVAELGGALLDAMFIRTLDADVERIRRINQTLRLLPRDTPHPAGLRQIDVLVLRPSLDLGALVLGVLEAFPYSIRHLFRGLGADEQMGWDLLSYFAFDAEYTRALVELGRNDTFARADAIRSFLEPPQKLPGPLEPAPALM